MTSYGNGLIIGTITAGGLYYYDIASQLVTEILPPGSITDGFDMALFSDSDGTKLYIVNQVLYQIMVFSISDIGTLAPAASFLGTIESSTNFDQPLRISIGEGRVWTPNTRWTSVRAPADGESDPSTFGESFDLVGVDISKIELGPTQSPTQTPVSIPTESPVTRPTRSPSSPPTNTPKTDPTEIPVSSPTMAPVPAPVKTPSPAWIPVSTDPPESMVPMTSAPILNVIPTLSPTTVPVFQPVQTPAPSRAPVISSTESPVVVPPDDKTALPSMHADDSTEPSAGEQQGAPTGRPTIEPSHQPVNAPPTTSEARFGAVAIFWTCSVAVLCSLLLL